MDLETRLKTLHWGGCLDVEVEGIPKSPPPVVSLALSTMSLSWPSDLNSCPGVWIWMRPIPFQWLQNTYGPNIIPKIQEKRFCEAGNLSKIRICPPQCNIFFLFCKAVQWSVRSTWSGIICFSDHFSATLLQCPQLFSLELVEEVDIDWYTYAMILAWQLLEIKFPGRKSHEFWRVFFLHIDHNSNILGSPDCL